MSGIASSSTVLSPVESLHHDIELYSSQLCEYIDKKQLKEACFKPRCGERMDAYHPIVRDACCCCFRGTNISKKCDSCTVWGFDGKLWVELSMVVFCDSVGAALKKCCGDGIYNFKEDWSKRQQKFIESAIRGVCASPLSENASVVGFSNGVWDFSDIDRPVFHKFSDMLPVTSLLPYAYDADAVCPIWESFLRMMLPTKSERVKLQKYLGLGVVNRRMMGHVIENTLWLIGSGANGKSTILNVVREVYGYDKVSEVSIAQLLERNQVTHMLTMSDIDGKIFNMCGEMEVSDMTRGSDAFKRLCSGEPQTVRSIGKDVRKVYDIPFLIFSMNQRPVNKRMDSAFRRRIVEVKFSVSVRPDDMDASLGEKLKGELPGIRNWMIEGYRMLVRDKFQFSHTNNEEYMESNGQYFDIFMLHEGLRPSAWAGHDEKPRLVSASVLHDEYCAFCQKNLYGTEPPSVRSMALDAKRLGYSSVRKSSGRYYEVYCDKELDYVI